jgi:NTP pyrophosphatase (non-canonical NTP hydrolase)
MRDRETTVAALRDLVRRFNDEREWAQYHSARNLAMALSVEASELLELYLWCKDEGPQPVVATRVPRIEEEVADVAICLLAFCERTGIDLASAVERKVAAHAVRYPVDEARGRLEKADELRESSRQGGPGGWPRS